MGRPNIIIRISPVHSMQLIDHGGYETRNHATAELLRAAERLISVRRELEVPVYTSDGMWDRCEVISFAYSKREENRGDNVLLIPDHVFHSWPEVGIADYEVLCNEMVERSKAPPKHDTLFWIGCAATHPTRQKFFEVIRQDNRVSAHDMGWDHHDKLPGQPLGVVGRYVSLPDHCDYRYLIDLQGAGYSGRLKVLMFSGRLLFMQNRPWLEFFFDELRAWEHYVPVQEGLEDLSEKLDWARSNVREANGIAVNAQHYAMKRLTRKCALDRFAACLDMAQQSA